MRMPTIATGLWLGSLCFSQAHAHISLERASTHKSRYGDALIKEGPCGMAGGKRGENVYTYEPGETITVEFVEYIPHPGYFRFAFDDDGDDDFKSPASIMPLDPGRGCPASVLSPEAASRDQCMKADLYNSPSVLPDMDDLEPHVMTERNKLYTFQVKLPNVECDNCTLQVLQVMEDPVHGPYNLEVSGERDLADVYYQCIDLVLKKGASTGGAGGGHSASAAGSAAGSGMSDTAGTSANDDGGCSVRPGMDGSSLPMLAGLACVWGLARRRRRR